MLLLVSPGTIMVAERASLLMMLLVLRLLMLLLVSPGTIMVAERASPPILLAFLLLLLVPSRHIAGYKGRDMGERRVRPLLFLGKWLTVGCYRGWPDPVGRVVVHQRWRRCWLSAATAVLARVRCV